MRNTKTKAKWLAAAAAAALLLILSSHTARAAEDWSKIGKILGHEGWRGDDVYKVTVLRKDLAVKSGLGMPTPAELGLNSYAAFVGTLENATVVGDTCMLEHEVNPIIDVLRAGNFEIVALHNHMLTEEPRIFFMHFQARGDAHALARTIRKAWDLFGMEEPDPPKLPAEKDKKALDFHAIGRTLAVEGWSPTKGVWKSAFKREDLKITLDGQTLAPGVGLACWAAFYACPCGLAKVMGDTCVKRSELQGVIDEFRKGGIHISAIHNHLLGTNEPVMFIHIEAEGDAVAFAKTIRKAWDVVVAD